MPQPNKIPLAFAASGDKNVIPESTETTGLASWREGFPAITSAPFSEGGIAPKRADFNGIFNALSQAVMWMQQGGVYVYDADTDYEAGNVVLDAGGLYVANAANGPSSVVVQPSTDTTGATWKLVRLDLATQTAAGYMSAEDKTALDTMITSGSWTPALVGETVEGALNYSTRDGTYVKAGRLVFVQAKLVVSSVVTQPTGYMLLKGLPYTISSAAVIPVRGISGQNSCGRKLIHVAQNANGGTSLRFQGVNPSSIASTGQIENLRWNASDSSGDYIQLGLTAPMLEVDVCGCYLTSA